MCRFHGPGTMRNDEDFTDRPREFKGWWDIQSTLYGISTAPDRHRVAEHKICFDLLKLRKKIGERNEKGKRVDLTVSSRKKEMQLFTSAENSEVVSENSRAAVPENSDAVHEKILKPKESESAFQKVYKTFDLPKTIVHWG
ncbi:hypothetical protein TNIN_52211 [Trichonephila inaurata madagascariensis]|uniref:Uncharacterized protein n=1 Tax=Trichonephila inaurata madagascariensis TaxID=2747483 RepID=A0A8X6M6I1_9ARAC|nr:hypothetical protein TNIN_52211 [Trichonephila inaurata madagascariensis]